MHYTRLESQIDGSVNHVYEDGSEYRMVRRTDNITIYLSSHTGCSLGCRMCHLTSTQQTEMNPICRDDMITRAYTVLAETVLDAPVNYAFMARGDPLVNKHVNDRTVSQLLLHHTSLQDGPKMHARVCVSTIFPQRIVGYDVASFLFERFGSFQPALYWSLYSLDVQFRQHWLPEAQEPEIVAYGLKKWQERTF